MCEIKFRGKAKAPIENDTAWKTAEDHLKTCESAYTEIGSAGYFALVAVIRPLRDRLNSGERTQELYNEIMDVSL